MLLRVALIGPLICAINSARYLRTLSILLQVPLVIHWPGTPAQRINALTDHTDLMTTLMQRLLHVSTPASEYSQGQDLFNPQRRHYWVTAADNDTLAITTPKKTLVLNVPGRELRLVMLQWDRQKG